MNRDRMHATFDEIDRVYHARRPAYPTVIPASDPPVSQEQSDDMGNVVEAHLLEADLARARQLGEIGNPSEASAKSNLDGNVNTGSQVTLKDDQAEVLVFQVSGDNARSRVMNITLGQVVFPQAVANGLFMYQVVAVLYYGAGGAQNRVEIDWVRGQSFQVPGSFIRLTAKITRFPGQAAQGNTAQVSAFITYDEKARISRLYKSIQINGGVAHQTHSNTFEIPQGATEVQVVWSSAAVIADGNVVITIQGLDAVQPILYDGFLAGKGTPSVIPLAGFADAVTVFNNDNATDMVQALIVFTIEL